MLDDEEGEEVVVRPGPTLDGDDNPVPGVGATQTFSGCVVEPVGTADVTARGRDGAYESINIFVPLRITPPPNAVVDARGKTWKVDGHSDEWVDEVLPCVVIHAYRKKG